MPLKLFCCCYKHSTTIDDKPEETLPFEDRMKNEQSDFISRGIYLFQLHLEKNQYLFTYLV